MTAVPLLPLSLSIGIFLYSRVIVLLSLEVCKRVHKSLLDDIRQAVNCRKHNFRASTFYLTCLQCSEKFSKWFLFNFYMLNYYYCPVTICPFFPFCYSQEQVLLLSTHFWTFQWRCVQCIRSFLRYADKIKSAEFSTILCP